MAKAKTLTTQANYQLSKHRIAKSMAQPKPINLPRTPRIIYLTPKKFKKRPTSMIITCNFHRPFSELSDLDEHNHQRNRTNPLKMGKLPRTTNFSTCTRPWVRTNWTGSCFRYKLTIRRNREMSINTLRISGRSSKRREWERIRNSMLSYSIMSCCKMVKSSMGMPRRKA